VLTFPVLAAEVATGVFQEIYWLKAVEYLPFFILLAAGLRRRGLRPVRGWPPAGSLSVVVPTLNEEKRLPGCLERLNAIPQVSQVIVSDGGSVDHTRKLAEIAGAVVVAGPKGRGGQIAEGVRRAAGDVILILHADGRLDPAAPARILNLMKRDPLVAGGAHAMRFGNGGEKMRLISALNNLRARLTGISFGDQGQFFRSEALSAAGGFPDLMLMEDVEVSIRVKEIGRLALLPVGITASARRWEKRPVAANFLTVIRLFATFLVKRRLTGGDLSTKGYYAHYYRQRRPSR
jgi:rSAM/selenodomain-associated transferase 2